MLVHRRWPAGEARMVALARDIDQGEGNGARVAGDNEREGDRRIIVLSEQQQQQSSVHVIYLDKYFDQRYFCISGQLILHIFEGHKEANDKDMTKHRFLLQLCIQQRRFGWQRSGGEEQKIDGSDQDLASGPSRGGMEVTAALGSTRRRRGRWLVDTSNLKIVCFSLLAKDTLHIQ
ncbi:hypothetical protein ACUV84_004546 [Puccinellia chinampoensis]